MKIWFTIATLSIALLVGVALAAPFQILSPTSSPPPAVIQTYTVAASHTVVKGYVVAEVTAGVIRPASSTEAPNAIGIAMNTATAGNAVQVHRFGKVATTGQSFEPGESYGLSNEIGKVEKMVILKADDSYDHNLVFVGVATGTKELFVSPVDTGVVIEAPPEPSGS